MDFFESQAKAKRLTGIVILFFALGVAWVVFMVTLSMAFLLSVLFMIISFSHSSGPSSGEVHIELWLGVIVGATTLFILLGSWFKIRQLKKGGGMAIAEMLGGVPINTSTMDPLQRKLLNVVEEMAIASGVTVPLVYLLPKEEGINAFAAGYDAFSPVIGVTRGAVELLARDELQGVIGHEFSHILNGDMRLNIRLMGLIHGITMIGHTGQLLFWAAVGGKRGTSHPTQERGGVALLMLPAMLLMIIGYGGTFFGNLIKAAVSRQREYLADASSAQFTRYPQGLASALMKIGGFKQGSTMRSENAALASHMFFGQGLEMLFSNILSTHPPLVKRIKRLDPAWEVEFAVVDDNTKRQVLEQARAEISGLAAETRPVARPKAPDQEGYLTAGSPPPDQNQVYVDYARQLIRGLPQELLDAARRPEKARAVVFALLLNHGKKDRQKMLDILLDNTDLDTYDLADDLFRLMDQVKPEARLPLLDLAIPALRQLPAEAYPVFRRNLAALIKVDNKLDLFEWTLTRIVLRHLDSHYKPSRPPECDLFELERVSRECRVLLSAVVRSGKTGQQATANAFAAGMKTMGLDNAEPSPLPPNESGLIHVDHALKSLSRLAPPQKRQLLAGLAACIEADQEVTLEEGELLRAVADSLGCPMPPLLPGQPLGQSCRT